MTCPHRPWVFAFPSWEEAMTMVSTLGRETMDAEGHVGIWFDTVRPPWTFYETQDLMR